jgi:formyltetrahydrofolate synthetase
LNHARSNPSTFVQETLLPIQAVARKLEIPEQYFEQLGPHGGKVKLELLSDPVFRRRGKLIIVTATTPTAAGEGKTVTSISLTQGLAHIGKKVVITSREPSLGPVFGMKGGAGAKDLAERVVAAIAKNPNPPLHPLYSLEEPLAEKIQTVTQKIYGANGVNFSEQATAKLEQFTSWGHGKLPVCIAKTQYSLSDDPQAPRRSHWLDPQRHQRFSLPGPASSWSFPAT